MGNTHKMWDIILDNQNESWSYDQRYPSIAPDEHKRGPCYIGVHHFRLIKRHLDFLCNTLNVCVIFTFSYILNIRMI